MKRLLLLLAFCAAACSTTVTTAPDNYVLARPTIAWSDEQAFEEVSPGTLLFIVFYDGRTDMTVFDDDTVIRTVTDFFPVRINIDSEFAHMSNVTIAPTYVVTTIEGTVLGVHLGPLTSRGLIDFLHSVR